jgi:hypothetical protein
VTSDGLSVLLHHVTIGRPESTDIIIDRLICVGDARHLQE